MLVPPVPPPSIRLAPPWCGGAADRRRDAALGKLGYRVLRVEAELVHRDLAAAVARVRQALGILQ